MAKKLQKKRKLPPHSQNRTTYEGNRHTENPVKHGTNLKNGQNRKKTAITRKPVRIVNPTEEPAKNGKKPKKITNRPPIGLKKRYPIKT
jgi:hypothetical protein